MCLSNRIFVEEEIFWIIELLRYKLPHYIVVFKVSNWQKPLSRCCFVNKVHWAYPFGFRGDREVLPHENVFIDTEDSSEKLRIQRLLSYHTIATKYSSGHSLNCDVTRRRNRGKSVFFFKKMYDHPNLAKCNPREIQSIQWAGIQTGKRSREVSTKNNKEIDGNNIKKFNEMNSNNFVRQSAYLLKKKIFELLNYLCMKIHLIFSCSKFPNWAESVYIWEFFIIYVHSPYWRFGCLSPAVFIGFDVVLKRTVVAELVLSGLVRTIFLILLITFQYSKYFQFNYVPCTIFSVQI